MEIEIGGHRLRLLHQKAILELETNTLIIADLHIGKIEHFRSSGIGVPLKAAQDTILRLEDLIKATNPRHVIFLGDLFHSVKNNSLESLRHLVCRYTHIQFTLVSGNHDILSASDYSYIQMNLVDELYLGQLWLTHEPQKDLSPRFINLAGHLHPGVRLEGKGKQSIKLPCFYLHKKLLILPAFGYFTGYSLVKSICQSRIFAIADQNVYEI